MAKVTTCAACGAVESPDSVFCGNCGATLGAKASKPIHDDFAGAAGAAMGAPISPANRRHSRTLLVSASIAVVSVIVAVTAVVLAMRAPASAEEVYLEAATTRGANPFTDSVAKTTGTEIPGAQTAGERGGGSVVGTKAGLYGGTRDESSCDAARLDGFLEANPDKGRVWARVLGIRPGAIGKYVSNLTPVVLRADTRVTNHGFRNGRVTTFQSTLQAGTAALVDARGIPRVRCACGNPLTEPAPVNPSYVGEHWRGFSPDAIVTTREARAPTDTFVLTDRATDTVFERRVGNAADDADACPGEGTVVAGTDGVILTRGCEKTHLLRGTRVGLAYDDTRGGIVFQAPQPEAEPTSPPIMWLPNGAHRPHELVAQVDRTYTVLHGVIRVGGKTTFLLERAGPQPEHGEYPYDLVTRHLSDGAETTINHTSLNRDESRFLIAAASYGGGRFALEWGNQATYWYEFRDSKGATQELGTNPYPRSAEYDVPPGPNAISPDGARLAYVDTADVGGGVPRWRLRVVDLTSGTIDATIPVPGTWLPSRGFDLGFDGRRAVLTPTDRNPEVTALLFDVAAGTVANTETPGVTTLVRPRLRETQVPGPTTPPPIAPTPPRAENPLATIGPFVGEWSAHEGSLTINPDGAVTAYYRLPVPRDMVCRDGTGPDCTGGMWEAPPYVQGRLRIVRISGNSASALVVEAGFDGGSDQGTSVTTNIPPGETVELVLDGQGKLSGLGWYFCNPATRAAGECGA